MTKTQKRQWRQCSVVCDFGIRDLSLFRISRFVLRVSPGKYDMNHHTALLALLITLAMGLAPAHAQSADEVLAPLVELLGQSDDPAVQLDVLTGVHDALKGRRDLSMPVEWPTAARNLSRSASAEVRNMALSLGALFGDPQALHALRKIVNDPNAEPGDREQALRALVQKKDAAVAAMFPHLLDEKTMAGAALRAMSAYDDPQTPRLILGKYASLPVLARQDAINTLSARPASAAALLDAVEAGTIPSRDVSAFTIRQLAGLGDKRLADRLEKVWGSFRPTSKDKAARIAEFKRHVAPDRLRNADAVQGRVVFVKTCASCHKLFGEGRAVGPELTGSQRANVDYLLENLIDPNAVIGRDYQMSIIATADGRVLTGIIRQENDQTVTMDTANDTIIIPKADIEERKRSNVSMMPEGMLEKLTPKEIRDLAGYLASPSQMPLPAGVETGENGSSEE